MFKRSKEQEKKGSEKREDLLVSFLKDAHFVFAIIVERGMSRFFSLLKVFGLEKRLVQDTENFRLDDWCFENPNVDLRKFRESSVLFLEKSLA